MKPCPHLESKVAKLNFGAEGGEETWVPTGPRRISQGADYNSASFCASSWLENIAPSPETLRPQERTLGTPTPKS